MPQGNIKHYYVHIDKLFFYKVRRGFYIIGCLMIVEICEFFFPCVKNLNLPVFCNTINRDDAGREWLIPGAKTF